MRKSAGLLLFLAILITQENALANPWATLPGPTDAKPNVIGGYINGCFDGGQALPLTGEGWQVMKPSRNRYYGHPDLIDSLKRLAADAKKATGRDILIGDMSQPRGGPMPYGHASHETGLDADIWFELAPEGILYEESERNEKNMQSLLFPATQKLNPSLWKDEYATLIKLAAEQEEVERVFVNAAIKQKLCDMHAGAKWMRKVRPWRKHDDHFHLRLRCPSGNEDCIPQAPPPPGDGCDDSLKWWFSPEAIMDLLKPRPAPKEDKPPTLPAKCREVLKGN